MTFFPNLSYPFLGPRTPAKNPEAIQRAKKPFISICSEDLRPEIITELRSKANWKEVILIVTIVSLSIFNFIAVVSACAFAEVSPLGVLILAGVLIFAWSVHNKLYPHLEKEIDLLWKQAEEYEDLQANKIDNLDANDSLYPLLLRKKYLEKLKANMEVLYSRLTNKAASSEMTINNSKNISHEIINQDIRKLLQDAVVVREHLLWLRIELAFTIAVLKNPNIKGTVEDNATISQLSWEDRRLKQTTTLPHGSHQCFLTRHSTDPDYRHTKTEDQVLTEDPEDLSSIFS